MADKAIETLSGTVEHITYRNEQNGYTVCEINTGERLVTVVGQAAGIDEGEELTVHGAFSYHTQYGQQFKAEAFERTMPATANAIFRHLSSGAFKGIGKVTARRIVDRFGDKTLEVLENHPEELVSIPGISEKKAAELSEQVKQIFGMRFVLIKLEGYGVDPASCIKAWKQFGNAAVELVEQNPYCLCAESVGIPFEKADAIAQLLDFDADNPCRLEAAAQYVLSRNMNNGHTCLPREKLAKAVQNLLEADEGSVNHAIEAQLLTGGFICETIGDRPYIYSPRLYAAERFIAGYIATLQMVNAAQEETSFEEDISALEEDMGILFAGLQLEAIRKAVSNGAFILTGGPGTGKTTTIRAIIQLLESRGLKVGLTAPTGRAAQRMAELTGREAKTIHRLLEVDPSDPERRKFRHNEKNQLPYAAVIVDEMSMVDTLLFESLLRALRFSCKLIMVGDHDQLPSVGPGNILKDLIESRMLETVCLVEIFRQAAASLIVTNAHAIVNGRMPSLEARDNDFFFLRAPGGEGAADLITQLYHTRLPKTYGLKGLWDIQVICPTRVGPLGTMELNKALQAVSNPPDKLKAQIVAEGALLREGDKVMQNKNNYDIVWTRENETGTGIFNGDIGIIELIDRPTETILVRFEDRVAEYTFELAPQLELAYAITVHKSQGSEFEAVIMPLMDYRSRMYYRNLLYTAITRARKLLVITGQPQWVQYMVENNRKTLRYTNLVHFLRGDT